MRKPNSVAERELAEAAAADDAGVGPTLPQELLKGPWSRNLVLPDRHGHLRLTEVKTLREQGELTSDDGIRFLDEPRRHSA